VPGDDGGAYERAQLSTEVLRGNEKLPYKHIDGNNKDVDDGGAAMHGHAPEDGGI
jgi:hypothetical protein